MSVREEEPELTEAQQVGQKMSARDYFLAGEEKLINEWADKSIKLFKYRSFKVVSLDKS